LEVESSEQQRGGLTEEVGERDREGEREGGKERERGERVL
jgi:hypothetical protein